MATESLSQQAAEVAAVLVKVFERVLAPKTKRYFQPVKPLAIRVGRGQATYYRAEPLQDTVVIGQKMVLSKMTGSLSAWLSSREIQRFGYFQGQVSLLNSLAQTLCHEFAHLIQINLHGRRYGSVHNAEFYAILSSLHEEGVANAVRDELQYQCNDQGLTLPLVPTVAEAAALKKPVLQKGQKIYFQHNGQRKEAIVMRLNTKTVSAKPKNASGKLAYWRIPYGLIESN